MAQTDTGFLPRQNENIPAVPGQRRRSIRRLRSALKNATLSGNKGSFSIGLRLARNAVNGTGSVVSADMQSTADSGELAPDAAMGEALSVHYSGDSSLPGDIEKWLKANGIIE